MAPSSSSTDVNTVPDKPKGDVTDLLGEVRVLLSGVQTLNAFLILLPFNGGFEEVGDIEKGVYGVTFVCSLISLVLFTTPAAYHRLNRPLPDREAFDRMATRFMVAGLVPLSVALPLTAQLVFSEVAATPWLSWCVAATFGILIAVVWWAIPSRRRTSDGEPKPVLVPDEREVW